jgi:phosphocarrier protein HPr
MPSITLTIDHEAGLHARPAALFVQTAGQFASDITVTHGERSANAKSILTVLTLGAKQGSEVTITAEGDDAQEALDALKELVESNFGE